MRDTILFDWGVTVLDEKDRSTHGQVLPLVVVRRKGIDKSHENVGKNVLLTFVWPTHSFRESYIGSVVIVLGLGRMYLLTVAMWAIHWRGEGQKSNFNN